MVILSFESYAQTKAVIKAFPKATVLYTTPNPPTVSRVAVYSKGDEPVFVSSVVGTVDETTFLADFPLALKVGFINTNEVF